MNVAKGAPLLYPDSLLNVNLALNAGDFAKTVGCGAASSVRVVKAGAPAAGAVK